MSTYAAPLDDMGFVMRELVRIDDIVTLPGLEGVGVDTIEAILGEAARFAGDVLAPLNQSGDRQGAVWADGNVRMPAGFREAYAAFTGNGWAALGSEPDHGGMRVPRVVSIAVREMWNSANMAFALCPVLTTGAIDALHASAGKVLQETFLPRMVSGAWTGTMNLTEPQAGSDLGAVRTRAEPQPDGTYRVFGQKVFITYGEHDLAENIVHLVLARVTGAPAGTKGISLFVVPKFLVNGDGTLGVRNDVGCSSIEHKLGIHASPTCVMTFGERDGAVGYRVGEENRGLEYMFIMMNDARLVSGIQGLAVAERAYQRARAYANERVQGRDIGGGSASVPIIRHPDVRRMLLTMKCQIEAMRALTYCVAALLDKADRHPDAQLRAASAARVGLLTPVVKGWCTETGIELASIGIQVHGGVGYIEETGAAQYLRDARITAIYEGTTGIQANDLMGRKIVHDRGAAMRALLEEIGALAGRLAAASSGELQSIGRALQVGVAALGAAGDHVLANYVGDVRRTAVGAVPLLKLTGLVTGGWLMASAAEIAVRRLASGAADAAALEAKLISARFFADHVLSMAPGLAHAVCQGAGGVMDMADTQW
jgi:acyl-CoA dehydrogenase